ncbi:MAG: hypothetical protein IT223_00725, partial [Crocinitomicaceae bacterium]|nr:hypothetical protein [Crocinitomicaceae bacterium]
SIKIFLSELDGQIPNTWWDDVATNDEASKEIEEIFGNNAAFSFSKPTGLINRILQLSTDKNSIILDSFTGSGTTAHAVLELNKEDGGNRKFILVEQEDYANTITVERVRRVIKGVKGAKSETLKKGTGGSFSFFQLGDSIEIESILSGKSLPSYEELARYIFYTAAGQEFKGISRKGEGISRKGEGISRKGKGMSDKARNISDLPLTPNDYFIGETEHYELYMLYEPNIDWLKQNALTLDGVRGMPKYTGKQRLVFAPAKYVADYTLLEHRIDFCQLPYEIYRIQK